MGASDARHVPITCATNAVQGAECEFETAAVRLRHAARQCDGAEAGRGRAYLPNLAADIHTAARRGRSEFPTIRMEE